MQTYTDIIDIILPLLKYYNAHIHTIQEPAFDQRVWQPYVISMSLPVSKKGKIPYLTASVEAVIFYLFIEQIRSVSQCGTLLLSARRLGETIWPL